ncbi:unnamed protein product, partial [Closterium sp. NIES-53]
RAAPKPLHRLKRNPLKNRTAMAVLNPFAADKRKQLAEAAGQPKTKKARETEEAKKAGEAWYQTMISDSDYLEFENFTKWLGVQTHLPVPSPRSTRPAAASASASAAAAAAPVNGSVTMEGVTMRVPPPPHPTCDVMMAVKAALEEDAGDLVKAYPPLPFFHPVSSSPLPPAPPRLYHPPIPPGDVTSLATIPAAMQASAQAYPFPCCLVSPLFSHLPPSSPPAPPLLPHCLRGRRLATIPAGTQAYPRSLPTPLRSRSPAVSSPPISLPPPSHPPRGRHESGDHPSAQAYPFPCCLFSPFFFPLPSSSPPPPPPPPSQPTRGRHESGDHPSGYAGERERGGRVDGQTTYLSRPLPPLPPSPGDVTSLATIPAGTQASAQFLAKEGGVLAGTALATAVFRLLDPSIQVEWSKEDGDTVQKGEVFATVQGELAQLVGCWAAGLLGCWGEGAHIAMRAADCMLEAGRYGTRWEDGDTVKKGELKKGEVKKGEVKKGEVKKGEVKMETHPLPPPLALPHHRMSGIATSTRVSQHCHVHQGESALPRPLGNFLSLPFPSPPPLPQISYPPLPTLPPALFPSSSPPSAHMPAHGGGSPLCHSNFASRIFPPLSLPFPVPSTRSHLRPACQAMVEAARPATVLETRKTAPGLRITDKWAVLIWGGQNHRVRLHDMLLASQSAMGSSLSFALSHSVLPHHQVLIGGGQNHRVGLYDMLLVKDNHIAAAGGVPAAISSAREYIRSNGLDLPVEVSAGGNESRWRLEGGESVDGGAPASVPAAINAAREYIRSNGLDLPVEVSEGSRGELVRGGVSGESE